MCTQLRVFGLQVCIRIFGPLTRIVRVSKVTCGENEEQENGGAGPYQRGGKVEFPNVVMPSLQCGCEEVRMCG